MGDGEGDERTTADLRSAPGDESRVPRLVQDFGVLIVALAGGDWLVFPGGSSLFAPITLGSLLTIAGSGVGVAYGGYWLARCDLDASRYLRIALWFLGGTTGFLALDLAFILVTPGLNPEETVGWMLFAASFGGAGGLLVGLTEARAIQRAVDAERAALRAESAERQRELLDYLNSLLRHEVLNNANVISGYAELARDECEGDAEAHLTKIRRQSEDMTTVVRDVQMLLRATRTTDTLEVVDAADVVGDQLDALRSTYEPVEVESTVPESAPVIADALLPRVFGNLLTNAVEHHDGDTPRVSVTVDDGTETVTVRVADDGPGIPEDERDRLFERSTRGDYGFGLYLVRLLTERCCGAVELTDTGDDGSVFTVELPAAPGQEPGTPVEAPPPGAVPTDRFVDREPATRPGATD